VNLRAVLGPGPAGWARSLDQEKTPYDISGADYAGVETGRFPVVIIPSRPSSGGEGRIRAHLRAEGAVITTPNVAAGFGEFAPGVFAVDAPPSVESAACRALPKRFYFEEERFVTETVAEKPFGRWHRALVAKLKAAYWSRLLPYARLAYYPSPYEGLFSFRMDLDNYIPADHAVLCRLLAEHGAFVSCFVNMRSFEDEDAALRVLAATGAEIGSHAYIHHVYDRYAQNRWNIERAEALLCPYTAPVRGFSGPHGGWHPSLQRALEERNYLYSSEFTLDYDGLPFYPHVDGRASRTLQIPTHPVCEGVFMERHGFDRGMIAAYFSKVIRSKYAAGEPILIFGHPDGRIGRHPEIFLDAVAEAAHLPGLWKTTFGAFAQWWAARAKWSIGVDWQKGVRSASFPEDARAAIEFFFPDGRRVKITNGDINLLQTAMERLPEAAAVRAEFPSETPAFSGPAQRFKRTAKRWLDWETKTPLGEYRLATPRDWLRYGLRAVTHAKHDSGYGHG
jgi:hypothetical protein